MASKLRNLERTLKLLDDLVDAKEAISTDMPSALAEMEVTLVQHTHTELETAELERNIHDRAFATLFERAAKFEEDLHSVIAELEAGRNDNKVKIAKLTAGMDENKTRIAELRTGMDDNKAGITS